MAQRFLRLGLLALVLWPEVGGAQTDPVCSAQYAFPADIPVPTSQADDDTFQGFSWQSFIALSSPSVGGQISTTGDNVPQWNAWSSTVDLLSCQGTPTPPGCVCPTGGCATSGTRYYPPECETIPSYQNYRVLDQVGKVDDSFEEAMTGGLSGFPVIDRFGNFLRYEILVSPATYDNVIEDGLFDAAHVQTLTSDFNLICGEASYTGGDPANPQMGALLLKAAWMDVTQALQDGAVDAASYHIQQLLVFSPDYRNSTGEASCELRTLALVGFHFEHKTVNQPVWIWSTFEHEDNVPDCTGPMPGPGSMVPNTSCPDSVTTEYNFYSEACNDGAAACASCNISPATNGDCVNPSVPSGPTWCLDQPPNPTAGTSKLCRQVPVADYPRAELWNAACQGALGTGVWSNYMLISGQWGTGAIPAGCDNVARTVSGPTLNAVNDMVILPRINASGTMKPILGNTSMESYDRSNCMGCHSKAQVTNAAGAVLSTDFMYWLQLEVPPVPTATATATATVAPTVTPTTEPIEEEPPADDDGGSCQMLTPSPSPSAWMLVPAALLLLVRRRRS